MRTKDELFREAQRHIAGRRQQAVTRAERMRSAAFAASPELAAAEEARVQAGLALAMAAARGADTASAAKKLADAGQALENVLRKSGRTSADLEPQFSCPLCHDTGLYKGAPCRCVAQVARTLRRTRPDTVLIFVTNYKEYAPEGYEVNAFRYLAKGELDGKLEAYFEDALAVCCARRQTVELVCGGEPVAVPLPVLMYIESRGRDRHLHLQGGPRSHLVTHTTLTQLEELLRDQGFLRLHKSYLVNMAYLDTLQSTGARLTDGTALPVSTRSYRVSKQRFLAWKGRQVC